MEIDLSKKPPTAEQIADERKKLLRQYMKSKCLHYLVLASLASTVFSLIKCSILSYFIVKYSAEYSITMWFYMFLLSTMSLVIVAPIYHILPHYYTFEKKIDSISYIDDGKHHYHSLSVLRACLEDPFCDAYRLAVANQGRSLIVEEMDVIRNNRLEKVVKVSDLLVKSTKPLQITDIVLLLTEQSV